LGIAVPARIAEEHTRRGVLAACDELLQCDSCTEFHQNAQCGHCRRGRPARARRALVQDALAEWEQDSMDPRSVPCDDIAHSIG
jgi:hypothetical protein